MNRRDFLATGVGGAACLGAACGRLAAGMPAADAATAASAPAAPADRKALVGRCGLYCGLCDWRTRIPAAAGALREALARAEFQPSDEVRRFLDQTARADDGRRCRGGKCNPRCAIRKCASRKGVDVCPLCGEYPCDRIRMVARSEPTLLHDGQRIQTLGLDAWIDQQDQRRRAGFCYADIRCLPCQMPQE